MSSNDDGGFAIDRPEQIALFHVMQVRAALGLEIRSGMKFSNKGSLITTANQCGYSDKRTKRGVYADLDALIVANGGESRPLQDKQ